MKWTATRVLCGALLLGCLVASATGRMWPDEVDPEERASFLSEGADAEERASFLSEGAGADAGGASIGAGQDRAEFFNFEAIRDRIQKIAAAIKKAKADLKAHLDDLADKGLSISKELLDRAKALGVEVPPKLEDLAKQTLEKVKQLGEDAARAVVQAVVNQLVKDGRKIPAELVQVAERLKVEVPAGSRAGFVDRVVAAQQLTMNKILEVMRATVKRVIADYQARGQEIPQNLLDAAKKLGVAVP